MRGIIQIAKMDRLEILEPGEKVLITGSKRKLFVKEKIELSVENSRFDNDTAFVSMKMNGQCKSMDLQKAILYDLLKRTNLLDGKLKLKLDILFNKRKIEIVKDLSKIEPVALAYRKHIEQFSEELKYSVKVKVDGSNIVFHLRDGLEDPEFTAFFHYGIMLKAAVKNCKRYGVEKLIFVDEPKQQFTDVTMSELERMDLK